MAIEYKITTDQMEDDGIYYCQLSFAYTKYMPNGSQKELNLYNNKIVYAPYRHETIIGEITDGNFGIKQTTAKQIINGKLSIVKSLGKVNKDTFERWKISKANTKNNSIT